MNYGFQLFLCRLYTLCVICVDNKDYSLNGFVVVSVKITIVREIATYMLESKKIILLFNIKLYQENQPNQHLEVCHTKGS